MNTPSESQMAQQSGVNLAQLNNYKHWINTHLKKRPGVKLVENLQTDVSSGVPLIHLIEVISGHVLPDVNLNPKTSADYKENIEKVLKFMQTNSVKMQRTTSKELLEGNLKSIMRLILALAAHFKPTNLQQNPNAAGGVYSNQKTASSYSALPSNKTPMGSNKNYAQSANNICLQALQASTMSQNTTKSSLNQTRTLDSMTHLVQAACVSIADVRRYGNGEKNFNVKYVKRNNLNTQGAGTMPPPPHPPKFTSPTRNSFSNQATNPMAISNINNQTYVTQNSMTASPLRSDQYKPFVRSNFSSESSFSSSTIMSPTSQRPLANSTILNTTNNINCSIEHVRKCDTDKYLVNKNRTHIIETSNEKSNILSQVIPVSTSDSIATKEIHENNSESNKSSPAKSTSINNATVVISDKSACKDKEALDQIEKDLQNEKDQRLEETESNLEEVTATKKLLLNLQTLLMSANLDDLLDPDVKNTLKDNIESYEPETNPINGDINCQNGENNPNDSGDSDDYALSGLTQEEQITILRSKIQQLEILCSDLRVELNQHNFVSMHKVGEGRGLKSRVNEQDNTILEMKNEHLNLHLTNQQLIQETTNFKTQFEEQLDVNRTLKKYLAIKDEAIEKLKQQMSSMADEKKKQGLDDLNHSYSNSNEKENILAEITANKDRTTKCDATFIIPKQTSFNNSNNCNLNLISTNKKVINTEADRILYEAMDQVRLNYKSTHATMYLLDSLEKEIKLTSEKILEDKTECLKISATETRKTIGESACGSTSTSVSTSNSSSLTSSSANSPVLSANSISSSNNNFLSNLPGATLANSTHPQHSAEPRLTKQTSLQSNNLFGIEKQLASTNSTLKRSTDSIIGLNSQQICSNSREKLKELSKFSGSMNNKSGVNQQVVQNEGHVKKIVSRFQQVGHQIEDHRFISSSDILPLSKFTTSDSSKKVSNNNLLTISSTNSSTCSNDHSPSVHSSVSSSSCTPLENPSKKTTSTKCIYYIHKETQPYCVTLFKKNDSVTLQDFKDNVKLEPSCKYRFFFKTQEPEFGYLKEEVSCNETILPSFENRIVAWIEESH